MKDLPLRNRILAIICFLLLFFVIPNWQKMMDGKDWFRLSITLVGIAIMIVIMAKKRSTKDGCFS